MRVRLETPDRLWPYSPRVLRTSIPSFPTRTVWRGDGIVTVFDIYLPCKGRAIIPAFITGDEGQMKTLFFTADCSFIGVEIWGHCSVQSICEDQKHDKIVPSCQLRSQRIDLNSKGYDSDVLAWITVVDDLV